METLIVKTMISERKSKFDGPKSRPAIAEENVTEFGQQ